MAMKIFNRDKLCVDLIADFANAKTSDEAGKRFRGYRGFYTQPTRCGLRLLHLLRSDTGDGSTRHPQDHFDLDPVIVGEQNPKTPVSSAEFIHERIAASTLGIISNAAHFVNGEQTGLFNEALLKFIDLR
jgi:pimeloyl-ACP methyl ester carboxylesterase